MINKTTLIKKDGFLEGEQIRNLKTNLGEVILAWVVGSGVALDKKGAALGGWRLQPLSVLGDAMGALGAA